MAVKAKSSNSQGKGARATARGAASGSSNKPSAALSKTGGESRKLKKTQPKENLEATARSATAAASRSSKKTPRDSKAKEAASKTSTKSKRRTGTTSRKSALTGAGSAKVAKKSRKTTTSASRTEGLAKKKSKADQKLKYKLHQEVVYPLHGVGRVESIEKRDFRGNKLMYYIIYIDVSDMTVMIPVDKADELGIRSIVSMRESKKALKLIGEDYEPVPTDWKMRYQMNLDLLKSGSVLDIATVVRTLYHRSRVKELPILERKLFDSALRLLIDEVSFSLNKSKEDVEKLVFEKMEANQP